MRHRVEARADTVETEIASSELWSLFQSTYLRAATGLGYVGHHLFEAAGAVQGMELELQGGGQSVRLRGRGNGPIAAGALGLALRIDSYEERSLGRGADASALAIVEAARPPLCRDALRGGHPFEHNHGLRPGRAERGCAPRDRGRRPRGRALRAARERLIAFRRPLSAPDPGPPARRRAPWGSLSGFSGTY